MATTQRLEHNQQHPIRAAVDLCESVISRDLEIQQQPKYFLPNEQNKRVTKENGNQRQGSKKRGMKRKVCKVPNCYRNARSGGDCCIKHGGGPRCLFESCKRGARDKSGYCIKHGGGPRCSIEGCAKGAIKKNGYCINHLKELDGASSIEDDVDDAKLDITSSEINFLTKNNETDLSIMASDDESSVNTSNESTNSESDTNYQSNAAVTDTEPLIKQKRSSSPHVGTDMLHSVDPQLKKRKLNRRDNSAHLSHIRDETSSRVSLNGSVASHLESNVSMKDFDFVESSVSTNPYSTPQLTTVKGSSTIDTTNYFTASQRMPLITNATRIAVAIHSQPIKPSIPNIHFSCTHTTLPCNTNSAPLIRGNSYNGLNIQRLGLHPTSTAPIQLAHSIQLSASSIPTKFPISASTNPQLLAIQQMEQRKLLNTLSLKNAYGIPGFRIAYSNGSSL